MFKALGHNARDFFVDVFLRFFRIFAHELGFCGTESVALTGLSERNVFKAAAHTVGGNHFADCVGCPLNVVCGSRRNLVKNHLFGSAPAEQNVHFVD